MALKAIALCHNVVIEDSKDAIEYNASSPDELALVYFCKFMGFIFKGIDSN